jgi:hypothetical protein
MTDFDIVNNYMENNYSGRTYSIRNGNNCIWISMGHCEMYFTVNNGKIVDIQVD